MDWVRKVLSWLSSKDPALPGSNVELREAQQLRSEQRRHVDAIEKHVAQVSDRVRADRELRLGRLDVLADAKRAAALMEERRRQARATHPMRRAEDRR